MAEHTPGPWSVNGWEIVQQDCDSTFPPLASICHGNRTISLETINANTRLIAAAPELLAALRLAVEVMRDNGIDESMAGEFDTFTDAITKSEGRVE